jgi:hypothetical protein
LSESEISSGAIEVGESSNIDLAQNASFADAIKHLLDQNSVVLLTNQNVKFNYISYNHVDYPYYRTAY